MSEKKTYERSRHGLKVLRACKNRILSVFFPPYCDICGSSRQEDDPACIHCLGELKEVGTSFCKRCGKPYPGIIEIPEQCGECLDHTLYFERARSVYLNKGPAHDLVLSLKYARGLHLAPLFAKCLYDYINLHRCEYENIVLVPVPQNLRSRLKRGYNQAEEMARSLSSRGNFPFYNLLKKSPVARSQTRMNRRDRLSKNRNTISVRKKYGTKATFSALHYLLIDDVYTTGSTLNECARALKKAFPECRVSCLTFLRSF